MSEFHYEKVKDPTYFSENRVAAHSDHRYFTSLAAMEQEKEELRYSLNGLWKFHYAKNYRSTIPGFEKEDYCCKSGATFACRPIYRWKAMINRSMPMSSTPGRAEKR